MGLFKKSKHAHEDEWVTQTKNKIYAEVYKLVIAICGISIVVKFLLHAYTVDLHLRNDTEILILLVASLHYLHHSIRLGVFAAEEEMKERKGKMSSQKKSVFWSIGAGLAIAIFMGLNSAVNFGEGTGQSVYYFFLVSIGSLLIYLPVMLIIFVAGRAMAKRKSDRVVDHMLKDDADGEDDEKY